MTDSMKGAPEANHLTRQTAALLHPLWSCDAVNFGHPAACGSRCKFGLVGVAITAYKMNSSRGDSRSMPRWKQDGAGVVERAGRVGTLPGVHTLGASGHNGTTVGMRYVCRAGEMQVGNVRSGGTRRFAKHAQSTPRSGSLALPWRGRTSGLSLLLLFALCSGSRNRRRP